MSGSASRVSGGSPAREDKRTPSSGTTGRRPLFAYGYCDVQPITPEQLDTQRAYIKANPRSRLLRSRQRATLTACRNGFTTALTPSALRGFLLRECLQKHATAEALDAIKCRLLLADGKIALDTYGNRQLLNSKLLPVVCHRKDKSFFEQQKARCMEEAGNGAIMVSARISAGEQEIMNEMVNHGFPVIIIADNGFPERYHPSAVRLDLCATDRLLLVTPWQYQYRGKNEQRAGHHSLLQGDELRCPSPLPPKRRLVEKQRIKCPAIHPLQSRKQCSAVRPLQKKKTVFSGSPTEIKILKI